MRIGIDIAKAVEPRDGIGRYIQQLVLALAATDRDNEYRLYGLFEPVEPERAGAAFGPLPDNFRICGDRRPDPGDLDLFHCTTHTVPPGFRGRFVYTVYDLTFLTHPDCHTFENRLHCFGGTVRAALDASTLIAISETTRESILRLLGVATDRLAVVPPAADGRFRPPEATAERERLRSELDLDGPYLLHVGTVEPRKNLGRLLEAFLGLPGELRRRCPLVLAGGEGWLSSPIHRFAGERFPGGEVRFLGHVDDGLLPALYGCAEAFVYPSLAEGFGLPVLEAMACGAPVVCSRAPALPEVAGDAALYVEPLEVDQIRDALSRILTQPDLQEDLRRKGLARAGSFSWQRSARELIAIYGNSCPPRDLG